jgi:glucan-binding YG repeat protein
MMVSTAFAANHWSNEDGTWKYFDKDGGIITNTWAKSG